MDTLSESRLTEWTFIDLISPELSKGHRQVFLTLDGCANIQLLLWIWGGMKTEKKESERV